MPKLRAALAGPGAAVLQAPPGAGKTTVVPLELLQEPWLEGQRIVMLEPRRLAARAAARRIAATLNEAVGYTVGYRVRFDTRVSAATRIEVVTEGVLTRLRQEDPGFDGVGLIIFDEFHERSIHADLGLALTLESRQALRPDLRLLVMSATLEGGPVASLLGGAPVVTSEGRRFEVETRYRPRRPGRRLDADVGSVVREALDSDAGDVLVFLPGAGEIRRVAERLANPALPAAVRVHQLHGSLTAEAQDVAIAPAPAGSRKMVLATSIAETSLTIEGVRVVVDAGLMRVPRFSPRTGMTRLETVPVTRASADQRRGRAGRLAPGVCYRLWSAHEEPGMVPFNTPEILAADLVSLALDLAAAGVRDPSELAWLDPPPAAAWSQAVELLGLLGALDGGRITEHGRAMARLPIHPRLAHMLIVARHQGLTSLAAELAALLTDRDVARLPSDASGSPDADVRLRIDALRAGRGVPGLEVDPGALRRARTETAEWRRRLRAEGPSSPADDAGRLLAQAYPDRIARRRGEAGRFLLRSGRGATLPRHQALAMAEWIVAAELDDAGAESRIRMAAPLDPADVADLVRDGSEVSDEIAWDDAAGAVAAKRVTRLGAIVVEERPIADPDPDQVRGVFQDGLRRAGMARLLWNDAAISLRRRLGFLHHLDPSWPDVSDAALAERLEAWLGPSLAGVRRLSDVAQADLSRALLRLVPWEFRNQLDQLAPERIEVPSGSRIAVDYADPGSPVLAVRLQEVFGVTDTPRVGGGRVPVTLHLLSPAYRPVQVTRDLASFWRSGYFEVRKDLRGRYPKHHWPDDPLRAAPVRGARRRT